jgi:anti-anti-sigma factor
LSRALIHPVRTVSTSDAQPPDFRCTLRNGGLDIAWVRVSGDLDIATAPQLTQTLRRAEDAARRVVLDLRELTFMDTAGVHAIVDANVRAAVAGRRLVVVRGRPRIDRVLALTGAYDRLDIVDLEPAEPPVQALIQLAQRERTARRTALAALSNAVPVTARGALL